MSTMSMSYIRMVVGMVLAAVVKAFIMCFSYIVVITFFISTLHR